MKYCDKDAVAARMGGDEFTLMQAYDSEEITSEMLVNIRKEMDLEAKVNALPFPLSISVGGAVTDPDSNMTLEDYVKLADARMYEEKNAKKAAN